MDMALQERVRNEYNRDIFWDEGGPACCESVFEAALFF